MQYRDYVPPAERREEAYHAGRMDGLTLGIPIGIAIITAIVWIAWAVL